MYFAGQTTGILMPDGLCKSLTRNLTMKRVFSILVFSVFIFCNSSRAQNSPVQEKAVLVKRMIELNHYSPRAVDDSFSVSLFKAMVNAADSRRLLFLAGEYKMLSESSTRLDDELQGKGWEFLDRFTSLYKKSLTRADSIVTAILQKPFDFSLDENIITSPGRSYNFAAASNDLYSRWSRYLKFLALQQIFYIINDSTGNKFTTDGIAKLEPGVRDKIRTSEKKGIKRILENPDGVSGFVSDLYLNALATCFDPHTNYFSPERKEMFQSSLSAEEYSFGLEFEENDKGEIVIAHLTPGGPAWKSGELHKGDELLNCIGKTKSRLI